MAVHGAKAGGVALIIALLTGLGGTLLSGPVSARDVPALSGRIVDLAHLLAPDAVAMLTNKLAAHEERTGNQIVLLTIPSLDGEVLEQYSHRVATTWRLGQKGLDNGVLVLVVPSDRKVRIEVGYGLEGTLTDARTSRIIRDEMIPRFRAGDFPAGIVAGLNAIVAILEGTAPAADTPRVEDQPTFDWSIFLLAVVVGMLTSAIIGSQRRRPGNVFGSLVAFFIGLPSAWVLAAAAAGSVLVLTALLSAMPGPRPRGRWTQTPAWHDLGGGWPGGWGTGGMQDSSGSFSGGGGDFGGGGASGRW